MPDEGKAKGQLDKEQLVKELDALQERFAKLQRFCGDLDAFAYTVAHDLKRPLSLILGFAELLLNEHETIPREELARGLQIILESGREMNSTVDELLLLVHVRDEERVAIAPLDMGSIVAEALGRLDYIIRRRQVEVTAPTRWPEALGYAPWVEEVWYTFLSETLRVDASPLHIDIGAQEEGDERARFWLQVSSCGFTPQQQARLGQIYGGFKSDLVKRILKDLGGTYGSVGETGRGGELYFTLPTRVKGEV